MPNQPEWPKSRGLWRVLLFGPYAWLSNPNRSAPVPWQFTVSRVVMTLVAAGVIIYVAGRIW